MSRPFVCSTCRQRFLRQVVTRKPYLQQQQSISQTTRRQQATQNGVPFLDRREAASPRDSGRQYGHSIIDNVDPTADRAVPRGRYSGRSLRPEQLLNQLGRREEAGTRTLQEGHFVGKAQHTRRPAGSNWQKYAQYFTNNVDRFRYLDAWHHLAAMGRNSGVAGSEALATDVAFMSRLQKTWRYFTAHWRNKINNVQSISRVSDGSEENAEEPRWRDLERRLGRSLPTPTEIAALLSSLGLLVAELRAGILFNLACEIVAGKARSGNEAFGQGEEMMVKELVALWHDTLASEIRREGYNSTQQLRTVDDASDLDWKFLPTAEMLVRAGQVERRSLGDVIQLIVPPATKIKNDYHDDFESCVLLTVDILRQHGRDVNVPRDDTPQKLQYRPLLSFLESILERVPRPQIPPALKTKLERTSDPLLAYLEDIVRRLNLDGIPPTRENRKKVRGPLMNQETSENEREIISEDLEGRRAAPSDVTQEEAAAALPEPRFTPVSSKDLDNAVHKFTTSCVKRLGRAIENQNLRLGEAVWKEVTDYAAQNTGAPTLPIYLYEHCMMAFLTLRAPNLAIQVWNAVQDAGVQPSVVTWTVMMRGCSRAKDADTMESFWRRMRESGIQPDQQAWSVRLFGLIKSGRVEQALGALKQMSDEYVNAVRASKTHKASTVLDLTSTGDVDGVAKPTIDIMSTMVSALATTHDQQIQSILAWGRRFGLEPNVRIYNVLLNVSLRHSQPEQAMNILKRMQQRRIQPDSITFTIYLTALFQMGFLDNLAPEQQTSKLLTLVADIEKLGPDSRLDEKGYALAIDRMLKQYSNRGAARTLLEHMQQRKIPITPHIYTILMTAYFDAQPPDLAAVEGLWQRIRADNSGYGAVVDTIFYDRMIEGYARNHAEAGAGPMLYYLERMSNEGKRPSWRALEAIARALLDRSDWPRLRVLVDDIRAQRGLLRAGARGRSGQDEFWSLVVGTGLLEAEGITSLDQLRIRGTSFHSSGGGRIA